MEVILAVGLCVPRGQDCPQSYGYAGRQAIRRRIAGCERFLRLPALSSGTFRAVARGTRWHGQRFNAFHQQQRYHFYALARSLRIRGIMVDMSRRPSDLQRLGVADVLLSATIQTNTEWLKRYGSGPLQEVVGSHRLGLLGGKSQATQAWYTAGAAGPASARRSVCTATSCMVAGGLCAQRWRGTLRARRNRRSNRPLAHVPAPCQTDGAAHGAALAR